MRAMYRSRTLRIAPLVWCADCFLSLAIMLLKYERAVYLSPEGVRTDRSAKNNF